VAADLGLVAHAADGHAHELATQRVGDRLPERRLADAGRADETEDRPREVVLELGDREVLDDPLLDLLEIEVVVVERLAGCGQVEVVLRGLPPRQRQQPIEIRADDPVLGGRGRQLLEPRQLALGGLARVLGQLQLLELLAELFDLRRLGIALRRARPGRPTAASPPRRSRGSRPAAG